MMKEHTSLIAALKGLNDISMYSTNKLLHSTARLKNNTEDRLLRQEDNKEVEGKSVPQKWSSQWKRECTNVSHHINWDSPKNYKK